MRRQSWELAVRENGIAVLDLASPIDILSIGLPKYPSRHAILTALSDREISCEIALSPRHIADDGNAPAGAEGLSGRRPARGQEASRWRVPTPDPAPRPWRRRAGPRRLCAAAGASCT